MVAGFQYGGSGFACGQVADRCRLAAVLSVRAIPRGLPGPAIRVDRYFPFSGPRGDAGQKICGSRVARASDGAPITAAMRRFDLSLSCVETVAIVIGVGIAAFPVSPPSYGEKRAWHDIAVDTVVVHAELYELYDGSLAPMRPERRACRPRSKLKSRQVHRGSGRHHHATSADHISGQRPPTPPPLRIGVNDRSAPSGRLGGVFRGFVRDGRTYDLRTLFAGKEGGIRWRNLLLANPGPASTAPYLRGGVRRGGTISKP